MKIQENTERQKSQIEVGMHPARCIWFADLGLQEDTWEGKTSIKQKVLLGFEVAGQDFPIVKEYNASWAEKSNFGMDMVSWHGNLSATDKQEFDTKNLMEKECTLNIGLNSKVIRKKLDNFDPKKSSGNSNKILKFLNLKKYNFTTLENGLAATINNARNTGL